MEMKIFNHILYGNLMPWLYDNKEIRTLTENLKHAGNKQPITERDLLLQIQTLLSHKLDLIKWLKTQKADNSKSLAELLYSTELPEFTDTVTKFYSIIIDKESQRIFNAYVNLINDQVDPLIINFQTTTILRTLKRYIIAAAKEIRNRGYAKIDRQQMPLIPFVLFCMKYRLITLYFSIQKVKKDVIENAIELDDFYLMELNETKKDIHPIYFEGPTDTSLSKKDTGKTKRLSFGFRGNKDKLKTVINQLCIKVELLNEDLSPADLLVQLLTSKDIKPGKTQIHIGCDNKNLRYIIEKLMQYFESLSFVNIEYSQSFVSKKGTLLKANNFSKVKSFDPKLKATIDNIFKEMQ